MYAINRGLSSHVWVRIIGHQVYPGVLALFREITNHRSNKQREKPPKDFRLSPDRHGWPWQVSHGVTMKKPWKSMVYMMHYDAHAIRQSKYQIIKTLWETDCFSTDFVKETFGFDASKSPRRCTGHVRPGPFTSTGWGANWRAAGPLASGVIMAGIPELNI